MIRSNALLTSLSEADMASVQPYLKHIELRQKQILFEPADTVSMVYFPTTAVISLVATLSTGEMVEAAMIGRDGALGALSALDGKLSLSRAVVQLAGEAFVCGPRTIQKAALENNSLLSVLIGHERALYAQAQQSTACMASHALLPRLCRWLLRARDLSGSDDLHFTQEFLAEMLGVRRTSVTEVALSLQSAGLIRYSRGHIHILNVRGMHDASCECYETIRQHYSHLASESRGRALGSGASPDAAGFSA